MPRLGRPTRPIRRNARMLIRKKRLQRGRLTAPQTHKFVRTSTMSLSNNTDVSGIIAKNANYFEIKTTSAGGVIQYGSGSIYSSLEAIVDYTDFTTLFDAYRIDRCILKFTPFFGISLTSTAPVASSAAITVLWHDIIDTDDKDLPTADEAGLNVMRQYNSYRTISMTSGKPIYRSFSPRAAMAVYQGAFTAYAKAPKKTFYDANYPQTQFYGYKFICEANGGGMGTDIYLYIKCEMTVALTCKDVR